MLLELLRLLSLLSNYISGVEDGNLPPISIDLLDKLGELFSSFIISWLGIIPWVSSLFSPCVVILVLVCFISTFGDEDEWCATRALRLSDNSDFYDFFLDSSDFNLIRSFKPNCILSCIALYLLIISLTVLNWILVYLAISSFIVYSNLDIIFLCLEVLLSVFGVWTAGDTVLWFSSFSFISPS